MAPRRQPTFEEALIQMGEMALAGICGSRQTDTFTGITLERIVTGPDLGAFRPSTAQTALIRAIDGTRVDCLSPERMQFHFGADGVAPKKPRTVIVRTGVRAGKSFLAAMALLWSLLTCKFRRLPEVNETPDADGMVGVRKGELVRALIVAPLLKLSRAPFDHLKGTMLSSPSLARLIVGEPGAESLRIRRPDGYEVLVELVAASSGGANLRSTWLAAVIFDEADFHDDEGGAVNFPDNYRAAVPRMLPDGIIVVPSSPWADTGPFHEMFTQAFGKPGRVLAFHSDTRSMNPTLSVEDEEAERARDPVNAAREYDAIPLSANSTQFFPHAALEAAVAHGRSIMLAPERGTKHYGGADLGFRKNSSAMALARIVGGKVVLAYHEEYVPPKDKALVPSEVVWRFADSCSAYGCSSMVGDLHYVETAHEELARWHAARKAVNAEVGPVVYEGVMPTTERQTAAFTTFRMLMQEGKLELPNDPRLLNQIKGVTSRPMPGGEIRVQLPKQGRAHGDVMLAAVLACAQAAESLLRPPAAIPRPKAITNRWGNTARGF